MARGAAAAAEGLALGRRPPAHSAMGDFLTGFDPLAATPSDEQQFADLWGGVESLHSQHTIKELCHPG